MAKGRCFSDYVPCYDTIKMRMNTLDKFYALDLLDDI